jgi:hypothetical protein
MDYVIRQPDEDDPIEIPFISITPTSRVRLRRANTDYEGDVVDDSGNVIAESFASDYNISFQIDIYSAENSSYDAHDIGYMVEDTVLYKHDIHSLGQPFLDENGNAIEEIWRFYIEDSEPADDLTMSPNLRRWRISATSSAYHKFKRDVDYIENVTYDVESQKR